MQYEPSTDLMETQYESKIESHMILIGSSIDLIWVWYGLEPSKNLKQICIWFKSSLSLIWI